MEKQSRQPGLRSQRVRPLHLKPSRQVAGNRLTWGGKLTTWKTYRNGIRKAHENNETVFMGLFDCDLW